MARQVLALGDTGTELVDKFNDNFRELYIGAGANKYIIQPSDVIGSSDWWDADTVYEITTDYDFSGGTIVMPSNVTLLFNGGVWSNGTIQGNNTIFSTNGLIQAFDLDLTLTGSWKNKKISPQYYGAITNLNSTTYSNNCIPSLQKCVDSIFSVYIPEGYYYFSTTLIPTLANVVSCERAIINRCGTIFYTDINVAFCKIRVSYFYFLGKPLFDYSAVASINVGAFVYDLDYSIFFGEIDAQFEGDETTLSDFGNGLTAVMLDARTQTTPGSIYFTKLNIAANWVRYPLWATPRTGATPNSIYAINLDVTIEAWGYKQYFNLQFFNRSKIRGWGQTQHVLDVLEKDLPAMYIMGQSTDIDVVIYDLTSAVDGGGHYSNYRYLLDDGYNNQYTSRTLYHWDNNETTLVELGDSSKIVPNSVTRNPEQFYISPKSTVCKIGHSAFKNSLFYKDKRAAVTLAAYDGTGYNFDTNLTVSTALSASPYITIQNPTNILSMRNNTGVVFTNASGLTDHFVELYIPMENIVIEELFYLLYGFSAMFNRVQTIVTIDEVGSDPYTVVANNYPNLNGWNPREFHILPFKHDDARWLDVWAGHVVNIIIRFIGCNAVNTVYPIYIEEIFCKYTSSFETSLNPHPIIDVGGGQTIYGKLNIKTGTTAYPVQTSANGLTAARPADPDDGEQFFDMTLGVPIWYNGSAWVDALGNEV